MELLGSCFKGQNGAHKGARHRLAQWVSEATLVRKGGLEPPQTEVHKILSPGLSLLTTISYNTESTSTTRNICTYEQPG